MSKFFAVSARAIEQVTAAELLKLGAENVEPTYGGVRFDGDLGLLYRSNLWLRTTSRILMPIKEFAAKTPEMLYDQARRLKWEKIIPIEKTFAVTVTSGDRESARRDERDHGDRGPGRRQPSAERGLTNTHYVALKIKDAIVDQLRLKLGARPNVNTDDPDIRIHAHLKSGRCELSLDSSGGSLHERGYRTEGAAAPLKETLAAAIVELSEWDTKTPFLDPMCGSGTLCIETALKALNIAPGLFRRRRFAFESWPDFDAALWTQVVEEARAQALQKPFAPIVGYDRNRDAVAAAIANAKQIGLSRAVHFERREIENLQPIGQSAGTLIVNPPYGERLGDNQSEIEALYKLIGDMFKQRMKGWKAYLFTGNLDAAKRVGLHTSRRTILYNGRIECRLLKYDLY